MADTYERPEWRLLPEPTPESEDYWSGGKDGRLLIHRCRNCGKFFIPGGPICFRCRSSDVGTEAVSGRGRVAAFTINRQTWIPAFPAPYVVAFVELEEQPDTRLVSNVVNIAPADVRVGLEVEVFFEEWEDVWIPIFHPLKKESN